MLFDDIFQPFILFYILDHSDKVCKVQDKYSFNISCL